MPTKPQRPTHVLAEHDHLHRGLHGAALGRGAGRGVVADAEDAVGHGDTVLIVDDVLATGGTASATVRLVEGLGATVAGLVFLIELDALGGREKLGDYPVASVLHF